MLLTSERSTYGSLGTLVRVPAIGGTPKALVEGALYGDWAPDGERLAVVRSGVCEFPVGQVIKKGCAMLRVSPSGDRIAVQRSQLEIVSLTGEVLITDSLKSVFGIAWAPNGREVWYTGSETGDAHDRALYALDMTGARRLIARVAGPVTVYDVAPDGEAALVATGAGWGAVNAGRADGGPEQPLDLLGRSTIAGLSADGKRVLLDETRGAGKGAYLRSTDGKEKIDFVGYTARGLSPNGELMLLNPHDDFSQLLLMPVGAGQQRVIPISPGLELTNQLNSLWSRDGQRIFTWLVPKRETAGEPKGETPPGRLYVREGEQPWRPVTPEMPPGPFVVSPDGRTVVVRERGGIIALYSIDGGPPRRLDGENGKPISLERRPHLLRRFRNLSRTGLSPPCHHRQGRSLARPCAD